MSGRYGPALAGDLCGSLIGLLASLSSVRLNQGERQENTRPRSGQFIQKHDGSEAMDAATNGLRVTPVPDHNYRPHPRDELLAFRNVTENRPCQEAANPRASTPSAMLNGKPDTAPADRRNSRYPRFATVSHRTDAQDRSVEPMPLPTYSHCEPSMPRDRRAYATTLPANPSRPLSISTSMLSPQSCRPAVMGGTEEGRPAKKSP
jgi:hypothetical protein